MLPKYRHQKYFPACDAYVYVHAAYAQTPSHMHRPYVRACERAMRKTTRILTCDANMFMERSKQQQCCELLTSANITPPKANC
jgi:hypothetical protein